MALLSIDPGLRFTGFVVTDGQNIHYSFTLNQDQSRLKKGDPKKLTQDQRMKEIYRTIVNICKSHDVKEIVSEKQFMQIMIVLDTLGKVAAFSQDLPFTSYVPAQWKRLLSGKGKMEKEQVEEYLQQNYNNLYEQLIDKTEHTVDALGIVIAHLKKNGKI